MCNFVVLLVLWVCDLLLFAFGVFVCLVGFVFCFWVVCCVAYVVVL